MANNYKYIRSYYLFYVERVSNNGTACSTIEKITVSL